MNAETIGLILLAGALFGAGAVLLFLWPRLSKVKEDLRLSRSCIKYWKENWVPYERSEIVPTGQKIKVERASFDGAGMFFLGPEKIALPRAVADMLIRGLRYVGVEVMEEKS